MRLRTFVAVLLLGLAPLLGPGRVQTLPPEEGTSDADMLVLDVRLDGQRLGEGLLAYTRDDRVYLPLGEMARLLELAVEVDTERRRAAGWIVDPDRTFELDLAAGTVSSAGTSAALPPDAVLADADDLYVDAARLARWWPVVVEVDGPSLTVVLTAREPLPVQLRLAREEQRKTLSRPAASGEAAGGAIPPYRLLSPPTVDLSAEVGHVRSGDGATTDGRWSALLAGDVLWMSGQAVVSGNDQDPVSDLRVRLDRYDAAGGLLGPLRATEFALGDIVFPAVPLLSTAHAERGAFVSSFPADRTGGLSETTILGDLPAGWEVELYRGPVLLDFQSGSGDGAFRFDEVPLEAGLNDFRLVFYGPQGQTREEPRRVYVGPGLLAPGELRYQAAVTQAGENLVTLQPEPMTDPAHGELRFLSEAELGLPGGLAVGAAVASLPLHNGRHTYIRGNVRSQVRGVYMTFDVVKDIDGGFAVQGQAQTRLLGFGVTAEHARFYDFESETQAGGTDPVAHRTKLRATTAVPVAGQSVNASLELEQDVRGSGAAERQALLRLSTNFGRTVASNTLRWNATDAAGSFADGALLVSGRVGRLHLRGELGYGIVPELALHTAGATAQWDARDGVTAQLQVNHDLDSRSTTVGLSLNRSLETASVGLNLSAGNEGVRFGLSLSTSLGYDPGRERWGFQPNGAATQGAVTSRVFVDANGSGLFDAGDQPVEGAEIVVPGSGRAARTGPDGRAFLTGLPARQVSTVELRRGSLEDPFLHPTREAVAVQARPGASVAVDYPLAVVGEIDGTVRRRTAAGEEAVRGVRLQLVDPRQGVVQSETSAFDGFYLFQTVLPGEYRVQVDPAEAARLGVDLPEPRTVTVTPEGSIVSGLDFVLEARP